MAARLVTLSWFTRTWDIGLSFFALHFMFRLRVCQLWKSLLPECHAWRHLWWRFRAGLASSKSLRDQSVSSNSEVHSLRTPLIEPYYGTSTWVKRKNFKWLTVICSCACHSQGKDEGVEWCWKGADKECPRSFSCGSITPITTQHCGPREPTGWQRPRQCAVAPLLRPLATNHHDF